MLDAGVVGMLTTPAFRELVNERLVPDAVVELTEGLKTDLEALKQNLDPNTAEILTIARLRDRVVALQRTGDQRVAIHATSRVDPQLHLRCLEGQGGTGGTEGWGYPTERGAAAMSVPQDITVFVTEEERRAIRSLERLAKRCQSRSRCSRGPGLCVCSSTPKVGAVRSILWKGSQTTVATPQTRRFGSGWMSLTSCRERQSKREGEANHERSPYCLARLSGHFD